MKRDHLRMQDMKRGGEERDVIACDIGILLGSHSQGSSLVIASGCDFRRGDRYDQAEFSCFRHMDANNMCLADRSA
jgi:hypothetical protein